MKPKHFILTLLALTTSVTTLADVPEGNITFADPAVKTICVALWDTNNDGELSYAEAAAVTDIDIGTIFQHNNDIITFNEFQFFTGVTSLYTTFRGCENLTSIILPNSITSIGMFSFYECWSLVSVNIPESVTTIDDSAFSFCGCTSINIPSSVTSIGGNAFFNCSSLTSITIGSGVTYIGDQAFFGCWNLTNVNYSSIEQLFTITYDGQNSYPLSHAKHLFINGVEVSELVIPDGVTSIRNDAFKGISSLTSVTIGDGVTSIGSSAFSGCSSLTSVTIGDGVTSIGNSAFSGCSSLTSINIPSSVTFIGGSAFGSHIMIVNMASATPCSQGGLGENYRIVVPTSAVDAYREAWSDCANVIVAADHIEKEVTVTAKETSSAIAEEVGENLLINVLRLKVHGTINSYDLMVFRNKMINLLELDLSDANVVGNSYCYKGGYFSKDNVITSYFIPTNIKDFKMPKDVTAIETNAFDGCSSIKTLTLPEGVTALGDNAFNGCSQLKTITLPEGITSIPGSCFSNCSCLSEITIPESVTAIGDRAFSGCSSLTSVIIPDDVTSIGSGAFSECSNLSYIYLPYYLQNLNGGWPSTLGGCSKLTEMHLPPFLTSIGDNTFSGCSGLKDIYAYMPNIISIGANTFNDYRHQNLYVPDYLYDQYYYETNWSQFLSVNKTTLRPDDYKLLATNSDNRWKPEDQRTPDKSDGSHVDGEVNTEGSFTVEGETPQQFNELDQILDGEGKGGSLIGEGEDNQEGNLTANNLRVNIHVKPGRWYFFIFPYDVTIENVEYPGQYAWLYYDAAHRAQTGQTGWKVVEGETLQALHGYAFQTGKQGTMVVTFNNPRFFGDKLLDLVAHAADNIQHASWNLVGNPHSSFYEFLEDAFSAPITRWNPSTGTYTAYRPGDDDIHLQPYEAFFVQKPGNMDHIKFKDVCRESYRKSEEKKANHIAARRAKGIDPQRRLINLEILSGEEQMDKTRVVLNNEKSHAYELDCDAAKMMSGDAKAQLYSVENGVNMAINERPQAGDIRLGYTAKTAGTLSISASRMDMPIMLVDTQLGTTFDLSLGSYDFDTAAGTFDGRFLLRPSGEATAINQLTAKTGVCIGTQDGGIAIGGAEGKTVRVFNAAGAEVGANDGNGFINLRSGIYVVSVDGVNAKVRVR